MTSEEAEQALQRMADLMRLTTDDLAPCFVCGRIPKIYWFGAEQCCVRCDSCGLQRDGGFFVRGASSNFFRLPQGDAIERWNKIAAAKEAK